VVRWVLEVPIPSSPDDPTDAPQRFEPSPQVLPEDAPLVHYAKADDLSRTPGVPVLRNNPFGESLGGGDMPFFTHGGPATGSPDDDDHEGIPTGLPAALHALDEVVLDADHRDGLEQTVPTPERLDPVPVDTSADTLVRAAPPLPGDAADDDTTILHPPKATLRGPPTVPPEPVEVPQHAVPLWMLAAGTVLGFVGGWVASLVLMPLLG
jgi:hypothetical protein